MNLLLALHSCLTNLISIIQIMKNESCSILSVRACCYLWYVPAPVRFLGWERLQICNKQNKVTLVGLLLKVSKRGALETGSSLWSYPILFYLNFAYIKVKRPCSVSIALSVGI